MAQHISIINNIFPEIQDTIFKRFSKRNIGLGSLRYIELKDKDYKLNPNDRVFIYKRKIKDTYEIFEIHFDNKEKEILDIFWVK